MNLEGVGAWGQLSLVERNELYRGEGCFPTTTERANNIPRVRWLQDIHDLVGPWETVLDIGCHDGFSTRWLLNHLTLKRLVGIDITEKAIEQAQILARGFGEEKADYLLGDYRRFAHAITFDAVVMFELVEHFTDDELRELITYATLYTREGGYIFITTPHKNGPMGESNPDPHHINLFTDTRLSELLHSATKIYPAMQVTKGGMIRAWWQK